MILNKIRPFVSLGYRQVRSIITIFSVLSEKLKSSIQELIQSSSEFNASDILVTIENGRIVPILEAIENLTLAPFNAILKEAKSTIKESGLNPLCLMEGTISWTVKDREVESPLFITPLEFTINHVKQEVSFSFEQELPLLNPFVKKQLEDVYHLTIENEHDKESVLTQLTTVGFETINPLIKAIGNFHHHRFETLRELSGVLLSKDTSQPLLHLFGETGKINPQMIPLDNGLILPADSDHREAFTKFETENIVIQGPPGTGKSQILTNFIGKLLLSNRSSLVVSEKRSALEVIYSKLESLGLSPLAHISSHQNSAKLFLEELENSWNFFDAYLPSEKKEVSIRKNLEDNLQYTLDLLNQEELISDVSYKTFASFRNQVPPIDVSYSYSVPELSEVIANQDLIKACYESNLNSVLSKFKPTSFEKEKLSQIQLSLSNWREHVSKINSVFGQSDNSAIEHVFRKSILLQLFDSQLVLKFSEIFNPTSPKQSKFIRAYNKLKLKESLLDDLKMELKEWTKIPNQVELEYITSELKKTGFLAKRNAKKVWAQYNTLPVSFSEKSIEHLLNYNRLKKEINKVKVTFQKMMIDLEASEHHSIHSNLHLFTEEKWEEYKALSVEQIKTIRAIQRDVTVLRDELRTFFTFNENDQLFDFLETLQNAFGFINSKLDVLRTCSPSFLKQLENAQGRDEYNNVVVYSHLCDFKKAYPSLSTFQLSTIEEKVERIIAEQSKEQDVLVRQVLSSVKKKFDAYHTLLVSPARTLSEEQKTLKKRLKNGKSILIKEFSKTRSHPSIRELMHSDALLWIQLLKPVWLSNPSQLANNFPLQIGLFDTCIFDEASQIPLQNGIGAIQRSQHLIVAGDKHQMGPVSYFKAGNDEVVSLLHQASFYLSQVGLNHHYRSQHSALIAFSNEHFYNKQLTPFESYGYALPPIVHHYLPDGIFNDRSNEKEAIAIAKVLRPLIDSHKSVGIVAFSQTQIDEIWLHFSAEEQQKIEHHIDSNSWFVKPLEKVQGDECEILLVSLGYAKNEDGNLSFRFGPLNQESGRNRLNVLLTRASQQIQFFSSIQPEELRRTSNESIRLLRKWLEYSTQMSLTHEDAKMPLHLSTSITENRVEIPNVYAQLPNAVELITLHQVLSSRGWKLHYN